MKKINIAGIILLCLSLHACTDDVQSDDTTMAYKAPTKFIVPIDKDDARFAAQAADKSMAEIELGRLAVQKGMDKRVKNLGAMMVKDHTRDDVKLELLAKTKQIEIPVAVCSDEQKRIDLLSKTSGRDFDKAYIDDIIRDHENNIKLFKTASTQLMDADLRGYAAKNLLSFERNLDAMNIIKGSMK